jgi:hypothetical protein
MAIYHSDGVRKESRSSDSFNSFGFSEVPWRHRKAATHCVPLALPLLLLLEGDSMAEGWSDDAKQGEFRCLTGRSNSDLQLSRFDRKLDHRE